VVSTHDCHPHQLPTSNLLPNHPNPPCSPLKQIEKDIANATAFGLASCVLSKNDRYYRPFPPDELDRPASGREGLEDLGGSIVYSNTNSEYKRK